MTTPFEDQLGVALRRRSSDVTIPDDGRAAIERRIVRRTRDRRLRRIGAGAALVVLLIGSFVVLHRGRDDAKVVTIPGVPAVHLPQLGLPPELGTNRVGAYSPGRQVVIELQPTSSTDPGGQVTVSVTDTSLTDVARASGHVNGAIPTTFAGRAALMFPADPSGPAPLASLVWQPADHVVAELLALNPSHGSQPPDQALQLASRLVELDDAAWWAILNPFGAPRDGMLALVGSAGHSEISGYQPTDAGGGGGVTVQVLDVPGYATDAFTLETFFKPSVPASGPNAVPSETVAGTTPDTLGPDALEVRGVRALVIAPPPDIELPADFRSELIWSVNGVQQRLTFDPTISPEDAAQVAEQLSTPTDAQWHALLFPSTIRIDLVPMPTFLPPSPPGTTGG